jgi:hypothetical protein
MADDAISTCGIFGREPAAVGWLFSGLGPCAIVVMHVETTTAAFLIERRIRRRATGVRPPTEQGHEDHRNVPAVVQRPQLETAQPQDIAGAEPNGLAAAEVEVDLAAIYLDERIPPLGRVVRPLASGLKDVDADLEAGW